MLIAPCWRRRLWRRSNDWWLRSEACADGLSRYTVRVCRYAFTSELGLPEGGFSHWHVVFTVLVPSAIELNGYRRAAERSLARGLSLFGTP